ALGHGIACVDRQVQQDLLHLSGIGLDSAKVGGQNRLEYHVRADEATQHPLDIGYHRVQVEYLRRHDLLATERQELASQRHCAVTGFSDLPYQARQGSPDWESVQQEVTVAVDDGEQVIEVVAHAARHLSDRLHLLCLP